MNIEAGASEAVRPSTVPGALSLFVTSPTGHPTEFGRIFPPDVSWLSRQPQEDILFPDLPIIDPHHHLWDLPGFRYLLDEFTADLYTGHNVVATVFAECLAMYRADGPAALRPVGETEFVAGVHAMSRSGRYGPARACAGIIGYADLQLGGAVEDVLVAHQRAAPDLFKGVRFSTNWDPSEQIQNSHTGCRQYALAHPAIREGLGKVQAHGLTFDAWMFHTQLAELADLADAMPDLQVVLNHCGGLLGYGPYAQNRAEHFADWKAGLLAVARRPNIVCKLEGILGRGGAFNYIDAPDPPDSRTLAAIWRPWFETCIEAFGAGRCMFESNFPVDVQGTGYATLWNAFKRIASSASPDEREALFAGTAARVYRLPI